jgi:hypothetical protein
MVAQVRINVIPQIIQIVNLGGLFGHRRSDSRMNRRDENRVLVGDGEKGADQVDQRRWDSCLDKVTIGK